MHMAGSRTFAVAVACVVPVCVGACSSPSGQTDPITGCKQLAITNLLQSPLPAGGAYGGVVSDGQNVYFSDIGSLYRVPISGGAARLCTPARSEVSLAQRGARWLGSPSCPTT